MIPWIRAVIYSNWYSFLKQAVLTGSGLSLKAFNSMGHICALKILCFFYWWCLEALNSNLVSSFCYLYYNMLVCAYIHNISWLIYNLIITTVEQGHLFVAYKVGNCSQLAIFTLFDWCYFEFRSVVTRNNRNGE